MPQHNSCISNMRTMSNINWQQQRTAQEHNAGKEDNYVNLRKRFHVSNIFERIFIQAVS